MDILNERCFYVYVHINRINQKKYVGITKKLPKARWENGSGYKSQPFYKAIEKYGWNNFDHIILEKELTLDEACEKEKYYIKLYDSYNNGYNASLGGECIGYGKPSLTVKKCICVNNGIIFNSIKEASDQYNITYVNFRAYIPKHRPILIDQKYYFFDYYEENKEYDLVSYYIRNKNSVICIETSHIFWNFVEAADSIGVAACTIASVCKHRSNHVKGFHFMYLSEFLEEGINNINYYTRNRKVICLSTNEIFNSLIDGANKYKLSLGNIFNCCSGKSLHAGKYNNVPLVWQYYDEYLVSPKDYLSVIKNSLIHCITLDLFFESIREASRYTNVGRKIIKSYCEGNRNCRNKKNEYVWEYYTPSINDEIEVIKCPRIKNQE